MTATTLGLWSAYGQSAVKRALSMLWYHTISLFFGGSFVANFVPHFVAGIQGRPFRAPFARLRGQKQSSPTLNVLWAAFNFAMAYELLRVESFDLRDLHQAIVAGLGALGTSLMLSRVFAKDSTGT
jgi:hypothetical protein